jgi:hypothetical protein
MTLKSSGKGLSGSTTSIEIMMVVSVAFTMHVISLTFAVTYTDLMNIWNDLPSPLRQKVIKSIQAALNNLILHEKGANNRPAAATKPCRVVLNTTAMDVLRMEPDIETPIISAICIPIAKEMPFNAEDGVEHSNDDSNYEHDDIHSARSRAQ